MIFINVSKGKSIHHIEEIPNFHVIHRDDLPVELLIMQKLIMTLFE
jgi:hypothetical protein